MIRSECKQQSLRESQGKQPYGMYAFDPRLGATWKVLEEQSLSDSDIAILRVEPAVAPEEDATRFIPWCEIWTCEQHPEHPVLRMVPPACGETLEFRGFAETEFTTGDAYDKFGRRLDSVAAVGVLGRGEFAYQKMERDDGVELRAAIIGASALGLNSGSPVLDSANRIVGIVSKSPAATDEYTLIALFAAQGADGPAGGGRHRAALKLRTSDGNAAVNIGIVAEFG